MVHGIIDTEYNVHGYGCGNIYCTEFHPDLVRAHASQERYTEIRSVTVADWRTASKRRAAMLRAFLTGFRQGLGRNPFRGER